MLFGSSNLFRFLLVWSFNQCLYDMWGHLNSRLVPVLVTLMGDVFPELKGNKERIRDIIKEEEEAFGKTLLKVHI